FQPNKYQATEGMWRTDENGIPIRADLSMDAANAAEPLQRNLFGDELPRQSEQEAPRTVPEALDSMPQGERSQAIAQELRGAVEPSGALEGAKLESEVSGGRGLPEFQGTIKRGQRGAINMDMFDPLFKVGKELDNGIRLMLRGSSKGP